MSGPQRPPRSALEQRARPWLPGAGDHAAYPSAPALDRPTETLPYVDLAAEPPDPELNARLSYRVALREGWMPWRRLPDGVAVVVTGVPTELMAATARELFDAVHVEFCRTDHESFWQSLEAMHRGRLLFESSDWLAERRPTASARPGLTWWQQASPVALLVALVGAAVVWPLTTLVGVLVAANLVFTASILFKTVAAFLVPVRRWRETRTRLHELRERARQGLPPVWRDRVPDDELPVYSILVPAYKEANVVEKVLANIGALDYPADKLDVLLLLEADDAETIGVARSMDLPAYVRILVVPPGHPQTKPRACNYGLAFARGRYVVIFDAEDRPDPGQLRAAVAAFARDRFEQERRLTRRPPLAVVQASLHYFNADYNVLTRMFAIEYAHWFEAMLPGMEYARLPLPLGGTSNHFDTLLLRQLGAWDPYNVTEDADAGLRVSVLGYRVGVIDSTTGEEACADVSAWIRQRTRWIKGYMLTAAVNTRRPWRFARTVGWRGVVGMLGLIAATPVSFMAYPLALGFTVVTYVGVQVADVRLPAGLVAVSLVTFLFGNLLMIVSAALATAWRYNWRIGVFAVLNPAYWLLHSVAAWRAFYQVIRDPHRWEKTPHGLTEDYESDAHV